MKNEKHVALAQKIFHSLFFDQAVLRMYSSSGKYKEAVDSLAAALSQVESDALASKVVGPSEKEQIEWAQSFRVKVGEPLYGDAIDWYRSQLTLAPTEPELKAQGFEEWLEKETTEWPYFKGNEVEQETIRFAKEAWDYAFLAGQKSKGIKLPEKMIFEEMAEKVFPALKQLPHSQYAKGYNAAIDAVKSLNEGENDG